jgi:hypothetical protein
MHFAVLSSGLWPGKMPARHRFDMYVYAPSDGSSGCGAQKQRARQHLVL